MSLFDVVRPMHFLRRLAFKRKASSTQPVPDVTPSDVERVVRRDFPTRQFVPVMALLKEGETGGASVRVQLGALKLAAGNDQKLRLHLESANRDYRDVLAAAEYPEYGRMGMKIHKMSAEEKRVIIDRDSRQYEEWLRK